MYLNVDFYTNIINSSIKSKNKLAVLRSIVQIFWLAESNCCNVTKIGGQR